MRVALVSDCYPPRVGGMEVQVRDLAAALVAAGHEVEVLTSTVDASSPRRAGGRVEVTGGPAVPVHRLGIPLPADLTVGPAPGAGLARRLRAGRFDVVHVHMGVLSPLSTVTVGLARRLGLPTLVTWHCLLGPPAALAGGVVRRWARSGVALDAVSRVAAEPVARLAGPGVPVEVLPNGLDVEAWRPLGGAGRSAVPPGPPGPAGRVELVTAMRLTRRKRPLPLVRMVRAAGARAGVPLRLTVFGDGPRRRGLEWEVRRLGLGEVVEFAGPVPRSRLRAAYAAAHVYVSPAALESFGIAALEARCAGLPVVALASSGVGEFVEDGVGGILAADDHAFVDAVAGLAADAGRREQMYRHNASVPPRGLDWASVVGRTEREYARAVDLARVSGCGARARRPRRRGAALRRRG